MPAGWCRATSRTPTIRIECSRLSSQRRANSGTTRSRSLRLLSDDPRTLARNPAALRAAITKTVAIETTISITYSSNDRSRRCGWPRPRRSVHNVRLLQRSASARLYRSHATTATNRTPDTGHSRPSSRRGARRCEDVDRSRGIASSARSSRRFATGPSSSPGGLVMPRDVLPGAAGFHAQRSRS